MADADRFAKGETREIFLGILDQSESDYLFEEEIGNMTRR